MAIKSVTIEFRETNDFIWKNVKPCENNIGESRWPHKPLALQGSHPGRGGVVAISGNFSWMFHWWQIIIDYHQIATQWSLHVCQRIWEVCLRNGVPTCPCCWHLRKPGLRPLLKTAWRDWRRTNSIGRPFLSEPHCRFEDDITIYISIYSTIVGLVSIMMCTYVHYTRMICFNRLFGLAMSW